MAICTPIRAIGETSSDPIRTLDNSKPPDPLDSLSECYLGVKLCSLDEPTHKQHQKPVMNPIGPLFPTQSGLSMAPRKLDRFTKAMFLPSCHFPLDRKYIGLLEYRAVVKIFDTDLIMKNNAIRFSPPSPAMEFHFMFCRHSVATNPSNQELPRQGLEQGQ
ncbi:uncharacterized protein LY79DRAFT_196568 [Colletotrichum navitas]|uniref:Uncharacterized protein n=1 Tax=Colletotrichum navitas TaxID=681940 RepID=A0AAD8PZD6_9PEZI|nr:uncharacterized protein LY79DRAFT_196568 [Colletotrichum navitas]KAK1590939.1 hypothetical protein LY79DRAFT_196568 [Colletotrichum navitas]